MISAAFRRAFLKTRNASWFPGNAYNQEERVVCAGYDNGDIKLFDLRNMSLRWETNIKNGVTYTWLLCGWSERAFVHLRTTLEGERPSWLISGSPLPMALNLQGCSALWEFNDSHQGSSLQKVSTRWDVLWQSLVATSPRGLCVDPRGRGRVIVKWGGNGPRAC